MAGEPATYPWTCPGCHQVFKAREGKPHPAQCSQCAAAAKAENAPVSPGPSALSQISAAILIVIAVALCVAHFLAGLPINRFRDDSAIAAMANAGEATAGRTIFPLIAICTLVVATSINMLRASAVQQEVKALRDDLARRAGESD